MEAILAVLADRYAKVPVTSIGTEIEVDWSKMNAETLAHLVWHGTKQKANDPNGAKDLTNDEKLANSQKVIDALHKNEVRMTSTKIADPFEAEVMRLAIVAVSNAILKKGGKLKDYKMADLRAKAQKNLDTNKDFYETLATQARATLATQAAVAGEIEI